MLGHGADIGPMIVALGTLLLGASMIGSWVVRRRESRLVAASPPSRVQVGTGRVPPSPRPTIGATAVPDRGPANDDPPYRMQMNAHAHAVEFVRWMRDHGFAGRYSAAEICAWYFDWFTRDVRAFPLPANKFLEALNKHPGVGKKRDRIKDAKGKVLKLQSDSPMRTMFYTIGEEPAVHAPSGVSALAATKKRNNTAKSDDIVAGFERKAA
ncbi:MAG: hypothetical protein ACK4TP_17395 [Hyphomicrobium sp.]